MATVATRVNRTVVAAYISDPNGDIAKDLKRRGRRVEVAAKRLVGKDTRALQRSIRSDFYPGIVPRLVVGGYTDYALLHHDGTRPHIIRPELRQRLRFKVRGRVVYTTLVRHPGTRGTHYLTIPLRRYAGG